MHKYTKGRGGPSSGILYNVIQDTCINIILVCHSLSCFPFSQHNFDLMSDMIPLKAMSLSGIYMYMVKGQGAIWGETTYLPIFQMKGE